MIFFLVIPTNHGTLFKKYINYFVLDADSQEFDPDAPSLSSLTDVTQALNRTKDYCLQLFISNVYVCVDLKRTCGVTSGREGAGAKRSSVQRTAVRVLFFLIFFFPFASGAVGESTVKSAWLFFVDL